MTNRGIDRRPAPNERDDSPQLRRKEQPESSPSAPPTSLLQQWGALLTGPTEWLSLPSCVGCLSQIADHGGGDADSTVERVLRAQANQNDVDISSDKHAPTTHLPRIDMQSISAVTTTPRLTNRSRASRNAKQGRIHGLATKIQSMPTPSSIRDQILAVHSHHAPQDASSPSDGDHSIEGVEVLHPLSSTLSSPIYTRSTLALHSTQRGNRFGNSSSGCLRRTHSLQAQPSLPLVERKQPMPKKSDGKSPNDPSNVNPGLLEGIQFSDGEGLFSNAIDLNWCCPTSTDASVFSYSGGSKKTGSELKVNTDCGGYVDYAGKLHPCASQRGSYSGERCQGCMFRRGMKNVTERNGHIEEEDALYYDSDPGELCTFDRAWLRYSNSGDNHLELNKQDTTQLSNDVVANSSITRRKVNNFRQKRRSKSCRTSTRDDDDLDTSTQHSTISQQEDHQNYIYDYFSRIARPTMETGICSTTIFDVGRCVQVRKCLVIFQSHVGEHSLTLTVLVYNIMEQDALSSTWRLNWHTSSTAKLCDVWIERGYRRNRTEIVEPKLMWRELPQPCLDDRRQLEVFTNTPHRVNLFSVRRILQIGNVSDGEVIDMDRHPQKHVLPFTKPNSLLLIRSSLEEDFIFEASCLAERDHIVHLLKITTARLVSHAVAGNGDLLLKEFFNDEHVP